MATIPPADCLPVPTLAEARSSADRAAIRHALSVTAGNATRAARLLAISYRHLQRLMAALGLLAELDEYDRHAGRTAARHECHTIVADVSSDSLG